MTGLDVRCLLVFFCLPGLWLFLLFFNLSNFFEKMKYHFPIVIIDEDYHSENVSGLGIRDLAQAIEAQGQEVSAVTTFSDLSSLARQASRTSAFIVSLDDDDFSDTGEENEAIAEL